MALFICLGFWQLDRAKQKQVLMQQFQTRMQLPPVDLKQLPPEINAKRYYPVLLTGNYDNAHSFLLDNKINNHRVGYEVLTPFFNNSSSQWVLINRGWIPAGKQRGQLPILPAINEQQTIKGVVYVPVGKPFFLGNLTDGTASWPLRIQALEISKLEQLLQKPLLPFVVWLSPQESNGFIRDWQPIAMPAQKHLGYAVQWFSFATVLILIYIVLNIRRNSSNQQS